MKTNYLAISLLLASLATGGLARGVCNEISKSKLENIASEKSERLIKEFEGFSPRVYPDLGFPAIGYGHRLLPGESYKTISESEATRKLREDIKLRRNILYKYVKVPLTENQEAALISFVYNTKENAFASSTLVRYLNAGKYEEASKQILRWNNIHENGKKIKSNGLTRRRQAEYNLFRSEQ